MHEPHSSSAEEIVPVAATRCEAPGHGSLQSLLAAPAAEVGPAFDQAAALSRVRGDQAFLCTMASMYIEEAAPQSTEIRAAVEQQDSGRLSRAAHKIKGSTSPLCANGVIESARILEAIGESGQMAGAMGECQRFESEFHRLLTELSAMLLRSESLINPSSQCVPGPEEATPCTA